MRLAERCILCCHTRGAIIEVANTEILAAHRDHWRGAKTEALGTENRGFHHIKTCLHAAIGL